LYLDEMEYWLLAERSVRVSKSTISRVLKRNGWTRKEIRRISCQRSEELRQLYRDEMAQFIADDLVFLDESIFNEKTGWRTKAYAPVGREARYHEDIRRGDTWSICAAMTLDGWLPCTAYKQGYFKADHFYEWITVHLLPTLDRLSVRPRVIVLDNVSIHRADEIRAAIKGAGHLL
jgi:hypothetical protein